MLVLALAARARGYAASGWLSYKQALALGGHVRRDEKGTGIVFWKPLQKTRTDRVTGEEKIDRFGVWRQYSVFNVEQCDGLPVVAPEPVAAVPEPVVFSPIEQAERLAAAYLAHGPSLAHGGDRACYSPALDHVQMPDREAFVSPEAYYSTLYHELSHSTGHVSRLDRAGVGHDSHGFGSDTYSREELVAEIASAFLAAEAGIEHDIPQTAAYCRGWLKALRGDSRLILTAAAQASRASDYVIGATAAADGGEEA